MERDSITEIAVSPELVRKAVQVVLQLEPAQAATLRGRAAAILDMLIDEGVVEGIVETGIAIHARLDAYVELISCPPMAELHPSRSHLPEDVVLNAISRAPLRLCEGRYRFCLRGLLELLSEGDLQSSERVVN